MAGVSLHLCPLGKSGQQNRCATYFALLDFALHSSMVKTSSTIVGQTIFSATSLSSTENPAVASLLK